MPGSSGNLRSGARRCHVTIQQPVTSGGMQSWQTFGTAWVAISGASGLEQAAGEGASTTQMSQVTMIYQPGIQPKMRIQYKGRTLEIQSAINVDEHNQELNLFCREVVI